MEKKTNLYETLYIIDPRMSEDDTKAMVERFASLISENGEIVNVDEWGRRRLAYPIEDQTAGYFMVVQFRSAPEFPAELARIFGITEGIFRNVIVRLNEKKVAAEA